MALDKIDMTNDVTKFCVSWVTCNVTKYGLTEFVASWNHHRIPSMYFYLFVFSVPQQHREKKEDNKT